MNTYEERFEDWRRLGKQLGLAVPKTTWSYTVTDQDGNILDSREELSRSWTRNAYNMFFVHMGGTPINTTSWGSGYLSYKDIDNRMVTSSSNYYTTCIYSAAINDSSTGIIVGASGKVENFNDYKLTTPILSGTDPGRLSYQGAAVSNNWDSGSLEYRRSWSRIFNNNSGDMIKVYEIGLYNTMDYYNTAMIIRDLVDPPIEIVDSAQLKVIYNIVLAFPE